MVSRLGKWKHKGIKLIDIDFQLVAKEYRKLIDSKPSEEVVQKFIETHCYILLQPRNKRKHSALVSKPKLAEEFIPDFVMFGGCNDYWITLVELEKPTDEIFNKAGDYSRAFSHALRQVADWKGWIQENSDQFRKYFAPMFTIDFEIIIGRRTNLTDSLHRLKTLDPSITVSTFDSLVPRRQFDSEYGTDSTQKTAFTFAEYKEVFRIGTGRYRPHSIACEIMRDTGLGDRFYIDPWFLYWLWDK